MTVDLKDRVILEDGTVICRQSAMIDHLYCDGDLAGVFCSDPQDQLEWEQATRDQDSDLGGPINALSPQFTDIDWRSHWMTPEPWCSIDLWDWCNSRCNTDQERDRVKQELQAMEARHMHPIIRHLIYCADTWRTRGVIWGVGRGSSVCSFVLYLTGINRINPLEHDLDLQEWLKHC